MHRPLGQRRGHVKREEKAHKLHVAILKFYLPFAFYYRSASAWARMLCASVEEGLYTAQGSAMSLSTGQEAQELAVGCQRVGEDALLGRQEVVS